MKRAALISLILATGLLAGCVAPAYRYSGGSAGYYTGSGVRADTTVIYRDSGPWYPYDGYGYGYGSYGYAGPWVAYPPSQVIYYRNDDRDGYRHWRGDPDGHHDHGGQGHYGQRGHRQQGRDRGGRRLSEAVRDAAGPTPGARQERQYLSPPAPRPHQRAQPERRHARDWRHKRREKD